MVERLILGKIQSRGVLLVWRIVEQGPTVLVVSASGGGWGGGFWTVFLSFVKLFFFLPLLGAGTI